MRIKVLKELKLNISNYVSGESLSRSLGVSRTSIWKYINELKKEGYEISSSSKKGYKLEGIPDIVRENEIAYDLKTEVFGRKIFYFDTIDSTNLYAKKLGNENCEEGTVIIADSQTAGRGRLGRHWTSASNKGIWMSIVLRPDIVPENAQIITIAAAVAVVTAIKKSTGINTGIKWPNDIILNGKKVCGILTEMNSEMERVNFIILGIGINVSQNLEDFPEDLMKLATSLKIHLFNNQDHNLDPDIKILNRSEIIKNLLYELEIIYSKINKGLLTEIVDEWKLNSVTLGKEVKVLSKSMEFTGIAIDITADGKLIVKDNEGKLTEVNSGEVSVKGILGINKI
jgi:BirA family transcriptional regulator, biotin operon repressor / biotin---[acetyl-CoA-carboxylase] ligase